MGGVGYPVHQFHFIAMLRNTKCLQRNRQTDRVSCRGASLAPKNVVGTAHSSFIHILQKVFKKGRKKSSLYSVRTTKFVNLKAKKGSLYH